MFDGYVSETIIYVGNCSFAFFAFVCHNEDILDMGLFIGVSFLFCSRINSIQY